MPCSNSLPALGRVGLWTVVGGLLMTLSACGDSAPLAEVPAPPTERQTPVMRCAPAADGTAVAAAEAEGCAISSPERLS